MSNAINYSQCWEDTAVLKAALVVTSDDIVFSITSGGDNCLALLAERPRRLVCLDSNPVQNYVAELKLVAAKRLSYDEYLAFLGVHSSRNRTVLFERVLPHLSEAAVAWWREHQSLVLSGIIHAGKLESFFTTFRRFLLPFAHTKKEIVQLLAFTDVALQSQYYDSVWNTWRWKLFFAGASYKRVVNRFARQLEMTARVTTPSEDSSYDSRLHDMITRVPLAYNFYMHYCLLGTYGTVLPEYLMSATHRRFAQISSDQCQFSTNDLVAYLQSVSDNTFSKWNLSDAPESLTETEHELLWREIVRVSKPGAAVAQWCHSYTRLPPRELATIVQSQTDQAIALSRVDRVFFYKSFHLYTIQK